MRTILNSLLLIALSILLNSCITSALISKSIQANKARKEITVENGCIPPNFINKDEVLLCQLRGRKSYDKYLKNGFRKNYFGAYEFIKSSDFDLDDKYKNMKKYRYLFDYDNGTTRTTTYSSGRSSSVTRKKFYVYDRLNDKKYRFGRESAFFAKMIKVYAENLEKQRTSKSN